MYCVNKASFFRVARALNYLKSDDETRQKYFGDAEAEYTFEFYPPLFAPKNSNTRYLTNKQIFQSKEYSDELKDAIRDKSFSRSQGGGVLWVIDTSCEKTDAARHIGGLKRNLITVSPTKEAIQAWVMAGDNSYQQWTANSVKKADIEEWQKFKERAERKPKINLQYDGPTLDHLFEKETKT